MMYMVLQAIGRCNGQFNNYQQQDSYELITLLLGSLSLREVKIQNTGMENLSDDGAAVVSSLTDCCTWTLSSCVVCKTCNYDSVSTEPYFCLNLPIPQADDSSSVSVMTCLDHFFGEEKVNFRCNCTPNKGDPCRTFSVVKPLPDILIIQLKRFNFDPMTEQSSKNSCSVTIPDSLDMSPYVTDKEITGNECKYELYAICNHIGPGIEQGHYTACTHNIISKKWYHYEDASVSELGENPITRPGETPYILFYKRKRDGNQEEVELLNLVEKCKETEESGRMDQSAGSGTNSILICIYIWGIFFPPTEKKEKRIFRDLGANFLPKRPEEGANRQEMLSRVDWHPVRPNPGTNSRDNWRNM